MIQGDRINLRSGPGQAYPVVGSGEKGQTFDIVGKNAEPPSWWQLCCSDKQRVWVAGSVVAASGPLESVPIVAAPPLPPTPLPPLTIADFNSCVGVTRAGGKMGAAFNPPNNLVESFPEEPNRGCVARLDYRVADWAAFWIDLKLADLRSYRRLVFDVRADLQPGTPSQLKLELKREGEVSIKVLSGIGAGWRPVSVNLADFVSTDYLPPVSSWQDMTQLVFTLEAIRVGGQGVVYLDNIRFER